MKKVLFVVVLALIFSLPFAHGQSACAQLGVDCSHPSGGGQTGNSGGNNRNTQEDNGPTNHETSVDWYKSGWTWLNAYKQNHQDSDFWEAVRQFKKSIYYDKHMGPAYEGMVKLMLANDDPKYVVVWAKEGQKHAEFGNHMTGPMKEWFKAIEFENQLKIDQAAYDLQCTVTTGPADSGAVDSRFSIGQALKDCQKQKAALDKESEKTAKTIAAYNKKY